jgi:hypothetical protein
MEDQINGGNRRVKGKLSATVHDFSGTIMHALLPKAYFSSTIPKHQTA